MSILQPTVSRWRDAALCRCLLRRQSSAIVNWTGKNGWSSIRCARVQTLSWTAIQARRIGDVKGWVWLRDASGYYRDFMLWIYRVCNYVWLGILQLGQTWVVSVSITSTDPKSLISSLITAQWFTLVCSWPVVTVSVASLGGDRRKSD